MVSVRLIIIQNKSATGENCFIHFDTVSVLLLQYSILRYHSFLNNTLFVDVISQERHCYPPDVLQSYSDRDFEEQYSIEPSEINLTPTALERSLKLTTGDWTYDGHV